MVLNTRGLHTVQTLVVVVVVVVVVGVVVVVVREAIETVSSRVC